MSSSSISSLDLFAIPFEYSMNNNKKKKNTILGGLMSIGVVIVSFMYLGYLAYLYFETQIQPTTSSLSVYYDQEFLVDFQSDFVGFQLYVQGVPIDEVEQQQNKKLINYVIYHGVTNPDGSRKVTNYKTIPCKDEQMKGFLCIDYSQGGTQPDYFTFTYHPYDTQSEAFEIMMSYCNNYFEPNDDCATVEETQALIAIDAIILFKYKMYQYNPFTKKLESRIKTESVNVSTEIVTSSQMFLIKSTAQVSDGIFIQSEIDYPYMSDYYRQDQVDTFNRLYTNDGLALYTLISFQIRDNGINFKVQYPLITTILAQFTSVFNTLLIVGFVAKSLAQSEIIQDFIDLYLKVYYKKTAYHLIYMQEKRNQQNTQNSGGLNQMISTLNLRDLYKRISSMNYRDTVDKHMKLGFFKNLTYTLFGKIWKFKNKESDQERTKLYSELVNQTKKAMNIFELHKEIITLKMMIRMIVSVEQFAAMQLCGVELQKDDQRVKNQINEKLAIEKEAVFRSLEIDESQRGNFKQQTVRNVTDKPVQLNVLEIELEQKSFSNQSEKEMAKNVETKDFEQKQQQILQQQEEKQQQQQQYLNQQSQQQLPSSQRQQLLLQETNPSAQSFNNHLEKIDLVEKDENYFEECLQSFLNSSSQPKSDVDRRIMDCMVGLNERTRLKNQISESSDQDKPITLR